MIHWGTKSSWLPLGCSRYSKILWPLTKIGSKSTQYSTPLHNYLCFPKLGCDSDNYFHDDLRMTPGWPMMTLGNQKYSSRMIPRTQPKMILGWPVVLSDRLSNSTYFCKLPIGCLVLPCPLDKKYPTLMISSGDFLKHGYPLSKYPNKKCVLKMKISPGQWLLETLAASSHSSLPSTRWGS